MKKIGCLQNKNQSVLRIIKNVLIYKKIISLFFAVFSFVFSPLFHLLSLGYVFLFSCCFCLWFSFCFYTHIHINSLLQTRQVKLMYLIFVFLWFFSIVFFKHILHLLLVVQFRLKYKKKKTGNIHIFVYVIYIFIFIFIV